ncbi:anti-sigma factor domain-containing protein [Jeotgalibacillus sp. JSM ZJ347]|uniref:anti-sigma factor domain-containing protein n=1 Tax=Jeotgalibacillus sp. JSM ZJ347 TaxID=3342117 RepID=UPI0035A983CC
MKKGIVMEVNKRHLVLLTGEGEFCRVRKPMEKVDVGDEVTAGVMAVRSYNHLVAAGALAAVFMIAFVILQPFFNQKTYAHVAVDINPSFEIELNQHNETVMLEPKNEDARGIFESLSWEEEPVGDVIEAIVQESIREGFITPEVGTVTVSTALSDEADEQYGKELESTLKKWSQTLNVSNVAFLKGNMDHVKTAEEKGISFGQLLAEQQSDKPITPEKPEPVITEQQAENEQEETTVDPVETTVKDPAPSESEPVEEPAEETAPANQHGIDKKEENQQKQEEKKAEQNERKEQKHEEKEKPSNNGNSGNHNGNGGNNGNSGNNGNNGNNGNSGNNGNNGNNGKNNGNGN